MAELAARLGSIDVYDRRGNVIWMDDFSKGKGAWAEGLYGTGAAIAIDTTYPKWPPFCLKMTGGSDAGRSCQIFNHVAPQVLGPVGLETSVAFFNAFSALRIAIIRYDGTNRYHAQIELNDASDKIYYYDSDGNYTELDDLPDLKDDYGEYHNIKLVTDLSTDTYVRFLLNQTSYDLSDYSMFSEANTEAAKVLVRLYFYSNTGSNAICRVGGVIVTQNEPLEP
jgi:hypothetical protein